MGTVYLGYHVGIRRPVAVKILNSKEVDSEEVRRFHREARAAAAIGHKGIVDVFDVGTTPWGDPYLVMEFLDGESLEALIDQLAPFDLPTACAIAGQLLISLAVAHERGIIHRDIKPGNIFIVCEGKTEELQVKLIDFGVSKISDRGSMNLLTQAGTFIGTPAYVAPEQANGDSSIDHRADLYSVGVMLYEMLTGELPFHGKTFNELILKIVSQPPAPPHEVNSSFPMAAGPLLEKALAKKPEERFQSATEMHQALQDLVSAGSVEQSLIELGAVVARSLSTAPATCPEPDSGRPGVSPTAESENDRNASAARPDPPSDAVPQPRPQRGRSIGKTTRRTRSMLQVALGAVVLLIFVLGGVLYTREPEAPTSSEMTGPSHREAQSLDPSLPPRAETPAPQEPGEEDPAELAGSARESEAQPQRTKPLSKQEQDTDAPREVAPAARVNTRSGAKNSAARKAGRAHSATEPPAKIGRASDTKASRFIKGGRHTEIAKDFE